MPACHGEAGFYGGGGSLGRNGGQRGGEWDPYCVFGVRKTPRGKVERTGASGGQCAGWGVGVQFSPVVSVRYEVRLCSGYEVGSWVRGLREEIVVWKGSRAGWERERMGD